jgi:signal transduction histidine kinase
MKMPGHRMSENAGKRAIAGIRQRVRLLGGRLTIESKPDSDTLIQVIVPILKSRRKNRS